MNAPVPFGGLTVAAGALVVGDDDGLVFLSPDEAAGFIVEAERRTQAELDWVAQLQAGETLCQVFDVPPSEFTGRS